MTINYNKPNHICLHAFARDAEGNEEYTDGSGDVTGWCVYNFYEDRHYGSERCAGEIDIDDEQNFAKYWEAKAEALRRGREFGVAVQEY